MKAEVNECSEDQRIIQKEMLEITIKAGRRLMHDFDHMLNEVPEINTFKKMYQRRAEIWRDIFYPDNGPKNYRNSMANTIMNLENENERLRNILKENKIDYNSHLPF